VANYNYRRLQDWTNAAESLRYAPDHETHRLFRVSLAHYIAYLHRTHPSVLPALLADLASSRPQAKAHSPRRFGLEMFWGVVESLKSCLKSSRGEALRLVLLGKWRAVQEARRQAERWPELALFVQELQAEE
jgi:hypothetical protein